MSFLGYLYLGDLGRRRFFYVSLAVAILVLNASLVGYLAGMGCNWNSRGLWRWSLSRRMGWESRVPLVVGF